MSIKLLLFASRVIGSILAAAALWALSPMLQNAVELNLASIDLNRALSADDLQGLREVEARLIPLASNGDARALRHLAWIQIAEGNPDAAADYLAKADARGGGDEPAYWQLGWQYWQRGASTQAAEAWKKVVRGDPQWLYKMLWTLQTAKGPGGDLPGTMIALAEDAVSRNPTESYPYMLLGQMYRHIDYETSDRWFQAALRIAPNRTQVLIELADNELWQKRHAEARRYLDEALAGDPRNPQLCALVGRSYAEEGRPDAAIPWYRIAVEVDPRPDYRRALASLYDRTARYELALAQYQALSQQLPNDAAARSEIERLQKQLGRDSK